MLHAGTGSDVAGIIGGLQRIAGTSGHAELIARCIAMLGIFRLSRQIATIDRILTRLTDASSACSPPCPAPAR